MTRGGVVGLGGSTPLGIRGIDGRLTGRDRGGGAPIGGRPLVAEPRLVADISGDLIERRFAMADLRPSGRIDPEVAREDLGVEEGDFHALGPAEGLAAGELVRRSGEGDVAAQVWMRASCNSPSLTIPCGLTASRTRGPFTSKTAAMRRHVAVCLSNASGHRRGA